ncbi:MAG: protein TolR [Pseudomonadales bacterium]|jgi:biopolymer transport protein TolR|nr:protein TolR [Pseudomonadales bacterium]MCP5321561.1 protein TolR [Pseudomonadales bacterium]MCP5336474.1 protein TolR [Pseudomonadales bacterium]
MSRERRKPMAEINVVPYIDVMLVLLIIFMITAPMLMQGVEVELPDAASEPIENQKDEPLIVSVKADGTYYINLGGSPDRPEQLAVIKDKVGKILKAKPKTPVLVWGDEKVPYGTVVVLMSELQQAGATSVGLVTENP